MKFYSFILFSLLFYLPVNGQIGGERIYSFLNLTTSAKQAALGGEVYTGLKSDVFQVLSNPAVLDSSMLHKAGLNYTRYLGSLNYGNLVTIFPLKNKGIFHFSILYLNYGNFEYADETGVRNGSFGAAESAVLVGYAFPIKKHLKVGINFKWIYSSLESYNSMGIAGDLGFYYSKPEKGIEAGLSIRNIGLQLTTYNGLKEKLPFEINAGFSQLLAHAPFKWHVSIENIQKFDIAFPNPTYQSTDPNGNVAEENITMVDQLFRHFIIGTEIFPRKKFTFRLGYNFRRKAELSIKDQNFASNIDFGFGLKLRRFEINYAYAKYHYASNAHFFSAIINLSEF